VASGKGSRAGQSRRRAFTAAYKARILQARICNIVQDDFLGRHLASADPEEQQYARASTLYRVGEYFGWTEILRRGLQFLDLGDDRRTRELAGLLAQVSRTFSDTGRYPAGAFRLFRDEQRALGEVMLEPADGDLRRTSASATRRSPRGWKRTPPSPAGSSGSAARRARSPIPLPGNWTG
jgi:hypothetical protein